MLKQVNLKSLIQCLLLGSCASQLSNEGAPISDDAQLLDTKLAQIEECIRLQGDIYQDLYLHNAVNQLFQVYHDDKLPRRYPL